MKLTIEIGLDNAAFFDVRSDDLDLRSGDAIARTLRRLADHYAGADWSSDPYDRITTIRDDSGSAIGEAVITG